METLLLVVPPEWLQLDWEYITSNTDLSTTNVTSYISAGMLDYIEQPLKSVGLIPSDKTLVEAKLLDDTYFIVRLG